MYKMIKKNENTRDHDSFKNSDWKKFSLEKNWKPISLHYLCIALQKSFEANWELVKLWVCSIPVDGEDTLVNITNIV